MTDQTTDLIDHGGADSTLVDLEITIHAPVEAVFDFLSIPDKVLRWMGISGDLHPEPGGVFHLRLGADDVAIGEYVEITPPTRISWTWGWEGNDIVPPGSSLVTFELDEVDGSTRVRLTHSGLPNVTAANEHREGWKYFFPRLVAELGDTATDQRETR